MAGVDSWDIAAETYRDNFPMATALMARLHSHSSASLLPGIGRVDLLMASPECTNHTCARGARERDTESQQTSAYTLNFVRAFRPRWVVIENVVQLRDWEGYPRILEALRRQYYVSVQVLDSSNLGVPQTRRRLFVICDREREPQDLSGYRVSRTRTAREILDPKGSYPTRPLFSPGRAQSTIERAERAIAQLGKGTPFLIVYYGSDGAGGWQDLDRPLRTLTTIDRFGLVEWNRGNPTLRMLQVPELKRAMGFDPDFKLRHGTRRDRIRLLGNGVCPPVMRHIVRSLVA